MKMMEVDDEDVEEIFVNNAAWRFPHILSCNSNRDEAHGNMSLSNQWSMYSLFLEFGGDDRHHLWSNI